MGVGGVAYGAVGSSSTWSPVATGRRVNVAVWLAAVGVGGIFLGSTAFPVATRHDTEPAAATAPPAAGGHSLTDTRSMVIGAVMFLVTTGLAVATLVFRSKLRGLFASGEVVYHNYVETRSVDPRPYINRNVPKVIDYDESRMLRCGAFCQYRGSVAVNSSVMLHVLITWLIAGGTWALVTATLSTAGLRVLDTASLSSFVDVFNALVAFLLGLFVSISLGRWWAVLFNHYGGLWGASDSLAMLIGAYSLDVAKHEPAESPKQAIMARAKNLILRYALLANYLLFMSARDYEDLQELEDRGLLTSAERAALKPQPPAVEMSCKAQVVWAWLANMCVQLNRYNCLPKDQNTLPQLLQVCNDGRGHIGAVGAFLSWKLPIGYVQLISLFMKVSMVAAAVKAGLITARGFVVAFDKTHIDGENIDVDADGTHGVATLLSQWVLLTVSVVYYQGLLEIQAQIANPFGEDTTDLSRRRQQEMWASEVRTLRDAGHYWPVSLETDSEETMPRQLPLRPPSMWRQDAAAVSTSCTAPKQV